MSHPVIPNSNKFHNRRHLVKSKYSKNGNPSLKVRKFNFNMAWLEVAQMRLSYPIPKSTLLNKRRGIVLRVTGINCQMHDSIVPRVHHSLIVAFSIGVLCFFSRMFLYFPHFPTTQCSNSHSCQYQPRAARFLHRVEYGQRNTFT